MKIEDLTKEQKQYLALGVIAVAAVGYLIYFLITKSSASLQTARAELETLNAEIEKAEVVKNRLPLMNNQYEQELAALSANLKFAPDEENLYSWVTELIYARARELGLEVDSVDEILRDYNIVNNKAAKKDKKKPDDKEGAEAAAASPAQFLQRYAVRVQTRGSYEKILQFVSDFEQQNPLLRVSSLEIIGNPSQVEQHGVKLVMEWPAGIKAEVME